MPLAIVWLSEKEAAAYLDVSISTIRRWRRIGNGPVSFRIGGIIRYQQADLDTFIQEHTAKTQ